MSSQKVAVKPKAANLIAGATGDWEVVIGMEVHAQVASNSKLFSGASTAFGADPNSHVSLVDAAMPGMLPVINRECVAQAIRTGLGLKAQINLKSIFDRKNYFYPDLPQGYQISQYKQPVVGEGEVEIDVDGEPMMIGIERLHLEQDAGKSLHDQHPDYSYVDLNRSGVALMEIVSKPDLRSSKQAQAYVTKLRSILRYLGTCDGDMEKGNLRADVNVSVRKPGSDLGTRCEIKNVNSIRFIGQAIEIEARRQIDIIEDGGKIDQETRLFDPAKGETRSMRSKEEAHDYRYFPDPDLLPLELTQDYVEQLKAKLPELPDEKRARFMKAIRAFGLRCRRARRGAAVCRLFRERCQGPRRQSRRELGHQRTLRPAEQGRSGYRGEPDVRQPARLNRRSHRVECDIGKDRQRPVRDRLERGRRSCRDRRDARHEAGDRYGRHRKGRRRHHCRQSREGRAGEGEAFDARLVRRPGDEGDGRQSQPGGRQ